MDATKLVHHRQLKLLCLTALCFLLHNYRAPAHFRDYYSCFLDFKILAGGLLLLPY
jgi:hypothetical protein